MTCVVEIKRLVADGAYWMIIDRRGCQIGLIVIEDRGEQIFGPGWNGHCGGLLRDS